MHYFIGTSGWHYDHWQGVFYPLGLDRSEWLQFYARHFKTVEINYSFYRLPTEDAFKSWYDISPPDFTFAVKVSRFITHVKRLKNCQEPLDKFLSRTGILKEKLGPLLYQLPPAMHRDDDRLESFLETLPRNLKHVFEFRHGSWLEEGVFRIIRKYGAALCAYDMGDTETPLVATSGFIYLRFHGSETISYSDRELQDWADRFKHLGVSEVYIYFNNDAEGFAIENAKTMSRLLGEHR